MREARNLRNMTAAQTPLLGDANAQLLDGTGNLGAAPRASVVQTPNPLLGAPHSRGVLQGETPMAARDGVPATPRAGIASETPLRTPFRDSLGVNREESLPSTGQTPREEKRAQSNIKKSLQARLAALPAPKNEFDIQLEGEEDQDEQAATESAELDEALQGTLSIEDAEERDARIAALKEEQRQKALARRSQAVQKGLPRPANVDVGTLRTLLNSVESMALPTPAGRAALMIQEEMIKLLYHDSVTHPVPGTSQAGAYKGKPILAPLSDDILASAKSLVHKELATLLGFPGANASTVQRLAASTAEESGQLEELEKVMQQERDNVAWNAKIGMWVTRSELNQQEIIAGKAALLEKDRDAMAQLSAAAAKEEKRLGKTLGGYQARSKTIQAKIREDSEALGEAIFTRNAFQHLAAGEESAVAERLSQLERESRRIEALYNVAQGRFRELDEERRELFGAVDQLEMQVTMLKAEREMDAMQEA